MQKGKNSLYILSIIWFLYALFVFYIERGDSFAFHNKLTFYVFVSYVLCVISWLARGNRVFSLFLFFVLYSFFSNTAQSIIYSFSESNLILSVYRSYSMSDICYMLKYNFLCIAALNLGVNLYLKKGNNITQEQISSFYTQKKKEPNKKIFEILLYLSLLSVFIYTIYQLRLRQTMTYNELTESREYNSYFLVFGSIILGLYFIILKRHVKLIIYSWVFYIFAYMLAGTRSMAIIYVGALLITIPFIYPRLFQRKYYPYIFAVVFVGFSLISVISETRTGAIGTVSSGSEGLLFSALSTMMEMGASQLPIMISIENFPQYQYSQTIIYFLLLGFIPAVMIDPLTPENWHIHLGTWVNEVSNTTTNELGFSWLAESYLNYGEFGWIFPILYGYFIAYAENGSLKRIMQGEYVLSICLLSFLCRQIFFARGQIGLSIDFYRPIVYVLILWIIIKHTKSK